MKNRTARVTSARNKTGAGYIMIAILPDGTKELPQDGKIHTTRKSVIRDAYEMYSEKSAWNAIHYHNKVMIFLD